MKRFCAVMMMAIAVGVVSSADSTSAVWETKADLSGIVLAVPPLKHPFPKNWQQTLLWWQVPLSFDKPAELKKELRVLAARGILPSIELCADYAGGQSYPATPSNVWSAIVQARAVAKAGFPVHIAMRGALDLYRMPDGALVCHTNTPDRGEKDAVGQEYPCLRLTNGWNARAAQLTDVFGRFAAAKVSVAGVWYDHEGHPHPWNGIQQHSRTCPGCAQDFPPELLSNNERFIAWAYTWRERAWAEAFAKPVKAAFPKARVGFYDFMPTSAAYPVLGGEANPVEIDAAQPTCYAMSMTTNSFCAAPDKGVPLREMDQVHFLGLLNQLTGIARNLRDDQLLVPFVTGYCGIPNDGHIARMSRTLYREFLRHAILRGARGFYIFNVAPPYGTLADFYNELADVNVVYNELFAYSEFLEGGETMNQEWIIPRTEKTDKEDWGKPGVANTQTWCRLGIANGTREWIPTPKMKDPSVWSGLRKGDKALIRVVALGEAPKVMDVTPFPGVSVRLLASPAGTSYIVSRSGSVECVD